MPYLIYYVVPSHGLASSTDLVRLVGLFDVLVSLFREQNL
jgi:hypothetical protein